VTTLAQSLSAPLARLSARERRLVLLFAGLAAAAAVYVFVVEPVFAGRARTQQRIESLRRDLPQMQALALRIKQLDAQVGSHANAVNADTDFSLFTFIDRAAAASLTRESIASMNPSRRPTRDGFEENLVELRVNGATLAELVTFLQRIESAEQPVYVKRLEFKRRYDDHTRFDATIVAGAVART